MKKFRWTFAFALLIAGFAAFTFFDYKRGLKEDEKSELAKAVIPYSSEQMQKIEIRKRQTPALVLEKRDGKWRLSEPIQDLADAQTLTSLLLSLQNEKVVETVTEGKTLELKIYGLDDPAQVLKVTAQDGKSTTVKFGAKAYDANLYAQIEGQEKILLVGSAWDTHLAKLPKDFRDKHLIRQELPINEVKSLSLAIAGEQEFTLTKAGDKWTVASGGPLLPVLPERISFYLDALKNVRAQEFADGRSNDQAALSKAGLKAPGLSLKVATDKATFTASVAIPKDEKPQPGVIPVVHAASSDYSEILTLARSTLDSVAKPLDNFLDRKFPFLFAQSDLKKIEVKTPKFRGVFERKGDGWVSVDPGLHQDLDSAKLIAAIEKLSSQEAVRVLREPAARVKAESSIRLFDSKNEMIFEFAWGPVVVEKATPYRPEAKFLTARTSKSEYAIGIAEAETVKPEAWMKEKAVEPAKPGSSPPPKK